MHHATFGINASDGVKKGWPLALFRKWPILNHLDKTMENKSDLHLLFSLI